MLSSHSVLLGRSLGQRSEQGIYTVLFADLRDSTAMSEHLPAEEMVHLLNEFLCALARPIIAHGGWVDKFLGDGVMAVFGMRGEPSSGAIPAARSALAMRQAVQELNEGRFSRSEEPVRFGVGICTGEVIVAPIGLPECSDVTAIGVTVNTAARLSGLCKTYGVDIVLSGGTTAQLAGAEFAVRRLGDATIQGRTSPLTVATLD